MPDGTTAVSLGIVPTAEGCDRPNALANVPRSWDDHLPRNLKLSLSDVTLSGWATGGLHMPVTHMSARDDLKGGFHADD